MALGRLLLETLGTGTKGPAPKKGLWAQACVADLAENTPVTLLGVCGDGHRGFPEAPWGLGWTDLGKQVLVGR